MCDADHADVATQKNHVRRITRGSWVSRTWRRRYSAAHVRHAKQRIRNYEQPAQTVQPWWFGDAAFKATSFYLRALPVLAATKRLQPPKAGTEQHKQWSKVHRASPGRQRWKVRSETYQGVANAMAAQWGAHVLAVAEGGQL